MDAILLQFVSKLWDSCVLIVKIKRKESIKKSYILSKKMSENGYNLTNKRKLKIDLCWFYNSLKVLLYNSFILVA